jgi:outer membrane receptor for ferrienterochelin and colicin
LFPEPLEKPGKSFEQAKNNANITNVISSDQIGRFPDANIGDALKRVPGITIQNDQVKPETYHQRSCSQSELCYPEW